MFEKIAEELERSHNLSSPTITKSNNTENNNLNTIKLQQ